MEENKMKEWKELQPELINYLENLNFEQRNVLVKQIEKYPPNMWNIELQTAKQQVKLISEVKHYIPPNYISTHFAHFDKNLIKNGANMVDFNRIDNPMFNELWEHGLKLIGEGKTSIIILAGGQVSRFGSEIYKGFYPVCEISQKSLFQLFIERLIRLMELYKEMYNRESIVVHIYIMTSPLNKIHIQKYFENNNYFGYTHTKITLFEQDMAPTFDEEGRYLLEGPTTLLLNPNGNGSIYDSLVRCNIMDDMMREGVEYTHVFSMDNIKSLVAYPPAFAIMDKMCVDVVNKCIIKTNPNESIGVFCSEVCTDNTHRACVVEYSEISNEMCNQRDKDGYLYFRSGNICSHFFSLKFLQTFYKGNNSLPYHIAHKTVEYYDPKTKQKIKPHTPNSYKLEKFIYDIFPFSNYVVGLELDRMNSFSPIKRQTGNDSIITARKDMNELYHNWLRNSNLLETIDPKNEFIVEILPLTSYHGEGLINTHDQILKK